MFNFRNEHPMKKKVTNEHPNFAVINVKDILTLCDKIEGKVSIPSFVVASYDSFPPSNFEPLAAVLCLLKDKKTALRREMTQLRQLNADIACVKHDIFDIELMLKI